MAGTHTLFHSRMHLNFYSFPVIRYSRESSDAYIFTTQLYAPSSTDNTCVLKSILRTTNTSCEFADNKLIACLLLKYFIPIYISVKLNKETKNNYLHEIRFNIWHIRTYEMSCFSGTEIIKKKSLITHSRSVEIKFYQSFCFIFDRKL